MTAGVLQTRIAMLGKAVIPSPLAATKTNGRGRFVREEDGVRVHIRVGEPPPGLPGEETLEVFELAGPRAKIYFDPSKTRCALVTCGGLCPGLNDIIRSIVLELYHHYGVRHIHGIRHGLQGFIADYGHSVMDLDPAAVAAILQMGGSILGSSRGPQDIGAIVDCLDRMNISVLFIAGGDGTLKAALRIAEEIRARALKIAVVGIPKTIDNDIHLVSRSFGFDTAVEVATRAIIGAHNEARAHPNGIGLIKLMGRHSGFIAATAALARQDVNFVLIPEVDFDFEGPHGLLAALEQRLARRGHAVIVAAEGAGQKYFAQTADQRDASGNLRLRDIGRLLKDNIARHFASRKIDITLKYIDPSYMIRSLPANANDSVYCGFLGRHAVHAGMAGKTGLLIGRWNDHFVHVPLACATRRRNCVDPDGELWSAVLEATGQGPLRTEPDPEQVPNSRERS